MAIYSKLGYGDYNNIDGAVEAGTLNGKDIVITKDTSEFIYIRDDNTKQAIRPRVLTFDFVTEANAALNAEQSTYAGQLIMIKDQNGKYQPYTVQKNAAGEFTAEPSVVVSHTGLEWTTF